MPIFFKAVITRDEAQGRLVSELLDLFNGEAKLVMVHLVKSGQLTLEDLKEVENALRQHSLRAAVTALIRNSGSGLTVFLIELK
jgi:hypothetical protein